MQGRVGPGKWRMVGFSAQGYARRRWMDDVPDTGTVHPEDIYAEARRRKHGLRLDEHRMREYVNGTPVPPEISQFCEQIDFAATALARLSPIPADFADDLYWPQRW